ncbi:carboxypeptidase-like regulatory domain-containing protein [Halomicronema hongdechloris]|nr:carboxypeptidase-like regulatory domain-containing protein [Halomicronema hongdechloris]
MQPRLLWLPILLAVVGLPAKALAHAVETHYVLDDVLEFQSTYSTGEPMAEATVEIYAPNNSEEPWLVTTTDELGRFSFLPDASLPGDWDVVIRQEGHGDILTVPVEADGGIDVDAIVNRLSQDIHYAATPALLASSTAVGLGGIALAFSRRRRMSDE